jgi:hypothetical protein
VSASEHLSPQQFVDLYHRTNNPTPILEKGFNRGKDQGRVYFTDNPEGAYSTAYGPTVLHAKVPAHLPQLDDEFGDEKHYTVDHKDLKGIEVKRWRKP